MSFPRYPKYKDSGVEWLGQVPEHWDVSRLGFESWVRARLGWKGLKAEEYVDDGFAFLSTPNIKGLGIDFENVNFITQERFDESPEIKIREGDVLLAKDGSTLGTVNVVRHLPRPTTVNSSIAVITPKKSLNGVFLYYLFASSYMEQTIQRTKGGMGVPHLFQEDLNKFYLPVPSLADQTRIAAFLDRETAKIDELVVKQQRLMELLDEQIKSLVLSSFQTPEIREIRLSEVSTIISRPVIQNADESYTRIGLFNRGRGLFHKNASEMDDMGESDFFWVQEGDLIISGQFAWEGAVALADKEDTGCVVSHRYPVIRGKAGIALTEYLLGLFWTKHGDFLLNENSRGAAGRNRPLNLSSLMKENIPVPDMEVQEKVARAVHTRKALFKEIAKAIDLLQERRTALISAAVTGQIDVRQT
jgi:type I restriction enzyme S subunit